MTNTELLEYVKQQMAQGISKETIYTNLISSGGWNPTDVSEVFNSLGAPIAVAPNTSGTMPAVPLKYAGFWIRWVAVCVDSLILIIPTALLQIAVRLVLGGYVMTNTVSSIVGALVSAVVSCVYFSWMTYNKGATLGKMMVGITVKSDSTEPLSLERVLLREVIGKIVSYLIIGIGFIMAGFTQKKQSLHDKMAHTVVVYKDPSKEHKGTMIFAVILACVLPALAIIGILSSVVLASLSTARMKGQDAATQSNLSMMRSSMEYYYSSNGDSYSKATDCYSGAFADPTIKPMIAAMSENNPVCYAEGETYAISAQLKDKSSVCVDGTGSPLGTGVAMDDGKTASCNKAAGGSSSSLSASGRAYTFTLPSGWIDSGGDDIKSMAYNLAKNYVLSIGGASVDAPGEKAGSITDIMGMDDVEGVVKGKLPGANIRSKELTSIAGEKAISISFNATVPGATKDKSESVYITQYYVVHNKFFYTLVFIAPASDEKAAIVEFKTISDSFKFK